MEGEFEGACYILIINPDLEMRHYVDNMVTLIAATQRDDNKPLTDTPCFAWNNRGRGEMIIWIREK